MAKIHDIRALAEVHAQEISRSPKDWMGYLDTASRVYRYSFQDSLLIHAQRPNAVACAELELWNDKMLRWVNRGAKGIALLDNAGPKERLRYVFDITDTHPVPGGRDLFIWQLTPESENDLLTHLTDAYGLEEKDTATVADALLAIAKSQAEENIEDSIYGLSNELEGTFLDGLDGETIRTDYKELLTNSIFYTLAHRCGFDPMEYLSEEDFTGITEYNKLSVLSFLGNATSSLCEPVLRDIGATMREIERKKLSEQLANSTERLYNKDVSFKDLKQESVNQGQTVQIEGGHEHGNELSSKRGLPVPESKSDRRRAGSNREVRDASEDVSTGESPELVYEHDTDGKTEPTLNGNRDISTGDDGELNAEVTTEVSGTRQVEGSVSMGSTYEQSDGDGRGDRIDGIGIQLTAETTEQDLSEAEEEIASALSLPEYPTANQQKRAIEERQAARYSGEIAIPSDVVDEVLRQGSNRDRGHLRLIYNFMAEKTPEEYMEFVKREYGTGGRGIEIGGQEYSVWWDELGMQIAVGHTIQDNILDKAFLSWEDVSGRIQQLLEQGEYAPQVVLDATRQNALAEHAEALVFMKSDLADGVAELVFDDPSIFDGSFPDAKERISKLLEQPEFLADLNDRLEGLAIAYAEDPEIMRFHYYKPDKVSERFKQFAKEVVPFQAREDFLWQEHPHFITQDEIDSFLTKGGVFSDSRLSTYAYFIADHTDAEKVAYIKEQYGTGGSSHALSGADKSHAEYDAKGLTLARGAFGESVSRTFLTWSKVAQRVNHLIETDQFLKPSDYSRMPEFEREQMATKVLSFYLRLPDEISRPFTRDFLNESARKELPEILADTERAENLLAEMDSALAALPLDFESYEDHARLLSELHQYVDGTFTIFPERKRKVELFAVSDEPTQMPKEEPPLQERINFRITDDDLGAGGPKTKFRANIDAIKLLKELESENRLATSEEQEVLSRFVGWGGISQAFDSENEAWSSEYAKVKELLTPEEYREARASTLNAFYTSPTVIKAMYSALENMGLRSGNVLEPSCGVGNFMGLVPESMDGLKMYGVELDSISGRIAGQLYQKNKIAVQGFETMDFPESFFDCTIGNVPFGDYKLNDPKYDRHNFLIHDYFIAKSLDLVRPGGVVAVITSSGTMDKQNESVRRYLANRADLLGAIRLPNNAFMRNANTGVVADILFFQKRDRAALEEPDWVHLGQTQEGYTVNSYFAQHPEMVLGEFSTESTQYGKQETTVKPIEGAVLSKQLQEAISHIHGTITEPELNDSELEDVDTSIPADPSVKNFSFANVDGQAYYRENSRMNLMELPKATTERILGMIEIRNITQELLSMQMEDCSDLELSAMQDKLNRQYDTFTAQYGLLSSSANRKAFSQDSSYCLLASLEIVDEEGNLQRKADIFSKRTIRRPTPVTTVDTASEALAVSIGEKAKVDLPFMAQLCGKTEDEVKEELAGVIFENPLTSQWETSDEYLSGNVREKLSVARQFAEDHPEYSVNVAYLERVQPKDLEALDIEVRLGATWIKPEYIQQFMVETFHTPWRLARNVIGVHYAAVNGTWEITGKTQDYWNPLVNSTYGTTRANAYRLLEDALNLKDTKIYDTVEDPDGKERRVINKSETMLAQQKQEQIKAEFKEWIFQDIDRREDLVKTYNTLFNSIRPREYDGSHIQFGGMTPEISLMQHQKDAVAHVLYGGNTLLAHCVGAGKTFQMIAAGMESKRLGLSQKSLYVVPNHLTEQWGSDFLRLYPGANVLVATKKDFEPANRKKFCSRIATGNYDAVIIGHSQFERIPLSRERQVATIEKQIDDITVAIETAKREDGTRTTVKQMEKTRRSLETRLEKLNNQTRKDDVVTFEQLGVDRLFVDESHNYKNLFLYTKMRNVAGISQTDAQKSSDMFMKCQYLDEITGGRGVTFATGTPVSNSMVELYTIMRYLQYDTLQKMGMGHFDSWAASFGETVTAIELAPEGTGYRAKTRFAKFYNLPELISLFKECADVQTADMLKLPVPEAEYVNVALKPSEIQKEMVGSFAERAEEVRSGSVDSRVDNMLKITNDGRKCALDQRLISDMLPDDSNSKVNCCVENAFTIWKDTAEDHSTQLIFCDLSTPKADGSFNVYDDVREKLVAKGIPKDEIAFIHEAATETKKAELFAKVRSGQVRILLGSTAKLGAGTNIQDRLIALHHLDCPWKPSDLEQQEGRILRQGNRNSKVKIFRYVTEGTFDAYMWQLLENKQKFISQIMTSKSPVRSAEDVDDTALSYAEIKALATGNPHIKEKMDLDIQVSKLKLLKSSHTSQIYRLESDIAKRYPKEIAATKERIAGLKSDLKVAKPILEQDKDSFRMVVGGKTFTDKKEAGVAITAACAGLKAVNTTGQIGEYQGFTMTASFDMLNQKYMLTLKRQCSYTIEVGKDALGNIQRVNNAIAGIEKKLPEAEAKLENLQNQLATAKDEVLKPFPQAQELEEKSARLAELNSMLNMDSKVSNDVIGLDEEDQSEKAADKPRTAPTFGEKASVLDRLHEKQSNQEEKTKPRQVKKKSHEQEI